MLYLHFSNYILFPTDSQNTMNMDQHIICHPDALLTPTLPLYSRVEGVTGLPEGIYKKIRVGVSWKGSPLHYRLAHVALLIY